MSARVKICEEEAELQLDLILEAFDARLDEDEERAMLISAIMDGRITFDQAKMEVAYQLARPLELKNDEALKEIRLREACAEDLEYINKGFSVDMDPGSKKASVSLGDTYTQTIRMAIRLGGLPTGVACRIFRRDVNVLGALGRFLS